MIQQLKEELESKKYDDFLSSLANTVSKLTEKERQELLVYLITEQYDKEQFTVFKKIFDLIIGSGLNLDFNIEHWAPTFLALTVHIAPEIRLFDYFVSKGASINFIGDAYAFENEKTIKNTEDFGIERYATCLDFIELKLADLIAIDYNFAPPTQMELESARNNNNDVTLSAGYYLQLLEQSQYLWHLIRTDLLKDHIVYCGGKTHYELKKQAPNHE